MVVPLTCALPTSTRAPLASVTCTELKDGSRLCVKDSETWRGAAPTDPPTGGLALASMAWACATAWLRLSSNRDTTNIRVRMDRSCSECEHLRLRRTTADERLAVAFGEIVVEIGMDLSKEAYAGAAVAVDRNHRLEAHLEIAPYPDDPRIDRTGGDRTVAEVV